MFKDLPPMTITDFAECVSAAVNAGAVVHAVIRRPWVAGLFGRGRRARPGRESACGACSLQQQLQALEQLPEGVVLCHQGTDGSVLLVRRVSGGRGPVEAQGYWLW